MSVTVSISTLKSDTSEKMKKLKLFINHDPYFKTTQPLAETTRHRLETSFCQGGPVGPCWSLLTELTALGYGV